MQTFKNFNEGLKAGQKAFCYKMANETPIDYMNNAIEMAKLSSSGDKTDTSFLGLVVPQPKIGGILVDKNEKIVYCACRSALKNGDHSEFTLMETLASNKNLEEAELYTTLEPCTPESRHKSESCSEIIINRRIKKVYIGTLDGNPLVFGRGVKYLTEAGVRVEFFDPSLLEKLQTINKAFFDFCKKYSDIKTLKMVDNFFGPHLSLKAVATYYFEGKKKRELTDDDKINFYRAMLNKKQIFKGEFEGQLSCTKDFALTFLNKPSMFVPGCVVGIVNRIKDTGKRTLIDMPFLELLDDKNKECIYAKINELYGKDKKIINDKNFTIFREIIVNAIIHTNYCKNICPTIIIESKSIKIINYSDNKFKQANEKGLEQYKYSCPVNPTMMEFMIRANFVESSRLGFDTIEEYMKQGINITFESDEKNLVTFKIPLNII